MDKKYCDKCEKEIKDIYYNISVFKFNSADQEEDVEDLDYCPKCYKKINF